MGMLLMLKEGGSLGIDTIGNKPIDEDIDLLPDTSGGGIEIDRQLMLWSDSGHALQYLDIDTLLLVGAQYTIEYIQEIKYGKRLQNIRTSSRRFS